MRISTNGIELNCVIEGEGPWVTMSHSLACNLSMWDPQMQVLTKHYKVLRFDTRGHGASSAPAGAYTLEQMADDVHGLFAELGIKRTHWIGLSMGGMIGETYALKYPGVFQSMVLADTTSRRPPNAAEMWGGRIRTAREQGMEALVESTLERWFTAPYRKAHPDVMARIGDDIRNTPVAGFAGCCEAIAKIDVLDRLKEIDCPALVMVGDQDHGTPPEMARQIHANLRGSDLLIIPDAAHLSNVEQSEVFNRALTEFLARN
ncbi:MAG: 3-oxoadipate enol-lactonase [Betaproteobacteria bacterium]|jgi:3-oxoadipate enol-lactonase|nr:3-oxoadipate enol-lactonase [Betaproteobacteria bacterium]MDH4294110.1 3-oxoadipate enol-lactonase [Betaproteobacteria bacterium]MDH5341796.1 3-oxoadipate enol-lactonase [Betaproteobacteria bacterium]